MKTSQIIYKEVTERMLKTINVLKDEFARIRTGRASPALVENIRVDSYGTVLRIAQLASIVCPEPRLVVIRPWDHNLLPEIEKAILRSDIGLTPSNDGVVIKLPIPPLTGDRRNDLVKIVHRMAEESKVALRNIRREAIVELKSIEGISEDDKYRGEKKIQEYTDEYTDRLDKLLQLKEKEIMEE